MDHFFMGMWGSQGSGDGQFATPDGIAVDVDGSVYVTEYVNDRIQKFTSKGTFLRKWGTLGTGDGQFHNPRGLTVDSNDDIYVVDYLQHRVQKFTRNGDFIKKWGTYGTSDGQIRYPTGIASFSGNSILVIDSMNYRIQEFSRDGNFITKWGSFGFQEPGKFNQPFGVAINKSNSMHYIADTGNHRIQRFHWDPGIVGPFPDEILEKLERLSIEEKKTLNEIVILALTEYLKKRNKKI
jgi:DNA-binding beta-propeller fold protein YncE